MFSKALATMFLRGTGAWRIVLFFALPAVIAHAQYGKATYGRTQGGQVMPDMTQAAIAQRQTNALLSQAAYVQAAARQAALQRIYSRDPWRRINGTTNRAGGPGWVQFQGRPLEKTAGGVLFMGKWGVIGGISAHGTNGFAGAVSNAAPVYGDDTFFVKNFPYVATSQQGYEEMLAFNSGNYDYTNSVRQVVTFHGLDYGTPVRKIWSPQELAAQQEKADASKQAAADKALKFNQAQADAGDAYGLLRMGERYMNGEGVEKDLDKARDYLTKAVQAGSAEAQSKLKELNAMAESH
jgi:TPR repeat protein